MDKLLLKGRKLLLQIKYARRGGLRQFDPLVVLDIPLDPTPFQLALDQASDALSATLACIVVDQMALAKPHPATRCERAADQAEVDLSRAQTLARRGPRSSSSRTGPRRRGRRRVP